MSAGRSLLFLVLIVTSGCVKVREKQSYATKLGSIALTGPYNVAPNACTPYSVGLAAPSSTSTVFTLKASTGLIFATYADCLAANVASSVTLPAGELTVPFFYFSAAEGLPMLAATAPGLAAKNYSVYVANFQVLGQKTAQDVAKLETGLVTPTYGQIDAAGHLLVADTGNNRVLIWSSTQFFGNVPPDLVLGQPDSSSNTANNGGRSAATLSGPTGVYSDGTKVFVADTGNNRVLAWSSFPTANNQPATLVLGQPNFGSAGTGATATTLNQPMGVALVGSALFVADYLNNRVLGYTSFANGQAAAFVLGQTSLTANGIGTTAQSFTGPMSVSSDGTKLFVADNGNNRVLIFNTVPSAATTAPAVAPASASVALGQASLAVQAAATSNVGLRTPTDVQIRAGQIYVCDSGNHRVLIWTSVPATSGTAAALVVGQADFNSALPGHADNRFSFPTGVAIGATQLFVLDGGNVNAGNHRILEFDAAPPGYSSAAAFAIGQPDTSSGFPNYADPEITLAAPKGIAGDSNHLYVSDTVNNRVLVWNSKPARDGQLPDLILGQATFAGTAPNLAADGLSSPAGLFTDGQNLFVVDAGQHRVLMWDAPPSLFAEPAHLVIGQTDFNSAVSDTTRSNLSGPYGVLVAGGILFISDTGNNRIMAYNSVPTTIGAPANYVLGQTDFASSGAASPPSNVSLNAPKQLYSDGVRLFVADSGNHRVLIWKTLPTAFNQPADYVLGQASMSGNATTTFQCPTGITGQSGAVQVSDACRNQITIWSASSVTGASSTGTIGQTQIGVPVGPITLNGPADLFSDGFRLFIADTLNARVTIRPLH